jgi:hypothetical protein
MGLFAKFRDTSAALGTWNAVLYAGSRLVDALFGGRVRIVKYYFMAQPISVPDEMAGQGTGSFAIGWADASSPLFSQIERPPAVIASRFVQGARCLAATAAGAQLAGFLWFVIGPYDEDEVRARFVPIPDGVTAWDFDVSIMPRFRMGRLFSYLWRRASKELAGCGVRQTLSRVSAFNAASIASHRRLGGRIVGRAVFVCVGRWQLMTASVAPKWHLSWRDDQRPVIAIQG